MEEMRSKVFGIGLNKTGTKTLARYLRDLGYVHRSYDSNSTLTSPSYDLFAAGDTEGLLDLIASFDSCEDWPWPMLYKELDARFPNARFVLTTRANSDVWFRSLCNMAVRIGPFPLYEHAIYGCRMPQGHRDQMTKFYDTHNEQVRAYFAGRDDKLVELCWDNGDDGNALARFLGHDHQFETAHRINTSPKAIYSGDSLFIAHAHRLAYQNVYGPDSLPARAVRKLGRMVKS